MIIGSLASECQCLSAICRFGLIDSDGWVICLFRGVENRRERSRSGGGYLERNGGTLLAEGNPTETTGGADNRRWHCHSSRCWRPFCSASLGCFLDVAQEDDAAKNRY